MGSVEFRSASVLETAKPYQASVANGQSNDVLAALGQDDMEFIGPNLVPTVYRAGQVLHRGGDRVKDVHFMSGGLTRLAIPLADGQVAAATIVGRDGAIGLSSVVSARPAVDLATVFVAGPGYRLRADAVRELLEQRPSAAAAFAGWLARQVAGLQVDFACCAQHTVEQRLARLLLITRESLGADSLSVTQEQLAAMLGVQRTTVSTVARQLKQRGALAYLRGSIRVANVETLAAASCGCSREQWQPASAPTRLRLAPGGA